MRHCQSLAGILVAAQALAFGSGAARAETRQRVDVTVSATAASNPFFRAGDNTGAVSADLAVDPVVTIDNEITSVVLEGHVGLDQYLERYGLDENLSLGVNARTRLSELTSVFGGLNATSSVPRGSDLIILEGETFLQPSADVLLNPLIGDITTTGQRLNTFSARAGVEHQMSSRENITATVSSGYTDVQGPLDTDYSRAGLQLIYGRQLSERSRLRATLQVEGVNYAGGPLGDATYATPMIGIQRDLGSRLNLTADIGATLSRLSIGPNLHRDTIGLAADINACRRGDRSTWCAVASRAVQPTSSAGLSTASSAGLSYNLQTSQQGTLSLAASYARAENLLDDPRLPAVSYQFVGGSVSYSRELNKRLFGVISSSVTSRTDNVSDGSQENLQIQVGIRSRFGNLK